MTSCEERAIDGINATPKVGIVLVNHEIDKIKGHFKVDKKKKKWYSFGVFTKNTTK